MAETYTNRLGLRKPAQSDTYDVDVFNSNADTIDAKTIKRPESGTSGNIAVLTGDRDVADGGKPVSALVDKVPSATVGNLAAFTNGGGIGDSGKKAADFADKNAFDILKGKLGRFVLSAQVTFFGTEDANSIEHGHRYYYVTKTVSWNTVDGGAKDNTGYAVTWTSPNSADYAYRTQVKAYDFMVDIIDKTTTAVTVRVGVHEKDYPGGLGLISADHPLTLNLHAIGGITF